MFDRRGERKRRAPRWLLLLLATLALCDPALVLRTLISPVRATAPVNAEPEPVESIAAVTAPLTVSRLRIRAISTLTVSRVPHRPESPLAPPWLSSALISTLGAGSRPLRC